MNFKDMDSNKRKKLGSKGGTANRTPQLDWAWDNTIKLRKEYQQSKKKSISQLAKKYNVNVRSLQRVIRGK